MASALPITLGALRASEFSPARVSRSVKDELRENLIARLRANSAASAPLFPGIVGYEDTVVPQLVNAVLSRHNFILLGLRGQAKSRILRALTTLLDPHHPTSPAPNCATTPTPPSQNSPATSSPNSATTPPSPGSHPMTDTSKNSQPLT